MWQPPPNLPPFLFKAAERVREWVYFQTWKFYDDPKRSERLEAIVLVLQVLVFRTDLVTNRVGTPPGTRDEWFRGITADYIARWTGLRLGRVTRALDDLRGQGHLKSVQPCELDEATGEYTGLAAVRNITMKLWTRLQLKNEFDTARNDACRRTMRAREEARQRTRRVRRERQRVAAKTSRLATDATPPPDDGEAKQREWNRIVAELRAQHPEWTSEELRAAADRLAPRR